LRRVADPCATPYPKDTHPREAYALAALAAASLLPFLQYLWLRRNLVSMPLVDLFACFLGFLMPAQGEREDGKVRGGMNSYARVRENPENPRARRRKPDASAQSRRMRPGVRRERFRRHLTEPDHAVAGPRGPARPAEAAPSWRTPHGYTRHTAARPGKNLVAGSRVCTHRCGGSCTTGCARCG